MLSSEKRLADVPLADVPAAAEGELVPNPGVVFPKRPLLPAGAGSLDPNPLPAASPPDPALFVEKLKPDAELNAEVDVDVLEVGAPKKKELAEGAEGPPEPVPVEEPNPDGGCVGTPNPGVCPNPGEDPKPLPPAAKLKVLAWAGAALPNPNVFNKNVSKTLKTDTQQLHILQIFRNLQGETIHSLPLLSKEDEEDPNPPATVEPKPPVDV